ncbi:MAG: anti-sigma factor family protein [Rubrobacteraceae bacterium]
MSDANKPGFEEILDWIEGKLPPERAQAVARHVATDEAARAEADWLRAFSKTSEDVVLHSPPPRVHEGLEHLFDAFAEKRREPGLLRRFIASLSFEGGMQPAFGVRSVGSNEAQRHFVYSTELADVSFSVRPRRGGGLDVLGQVLPNGEEEPGDFGVQIIRDIGFSDLTYADDLGEFIFEHLQEGTYEMVLTTERYEILIPPFELSQ